MQHDVRSLDRNALRTASDRAAPFYDRHSEPYRQICERLLSRLDYIRCDPRIVLDLGAGTGQASRALQSRYPASTVIAADVARGMLQATGSARAWRRGPRRVQCDAEALAFADASVDLLVSASAFHCCEDHVRLFAEVKRVLSPHGVLLFATFGPDTLHELRTAWTAVDDAVHVHDFADMHDLGDAMLGAGLIDPVVDAERLHLTYAEPAGVLRDLKGAGATNASRQRRRGLLGRGTLPRLLAAYPRSADGTYAATYEVIYGHAWGSRAGQRVVSVQFGAAP